MSVRSSSKLFRFVIVFILLGILLFLLFNDYGIVKYIELKSEVKELNHKIHEAENEVEKLRKEIDSLKNSDYKIEKTAREKYDMHGKNEKAIQVEEE